MFIELFRADNLHVEVLSYLVLWVNLDIFTEVLMFIVDNVE